MIEINIYICKINLISHFTTLPSKQQLILEKLINLTMISWIYFNYFYNMCIWIILNLKINFVLY